ncbi:translation initiation factor 4E [Nematocida homosporus]|uniref:translation initiation factor 4E n=1 Tax=Nematocida homosporus TaxID=1912981 RepID=UPI0022200C85|nr:translation initiation factor 4E [Nematocida homosporus]KAI5184945.1 translation initiation factor 4E [Nematocida homosporus]
MSPIQTLAFPLVLSSVSRTVHTKGETEDFRSKIKAEAVIKNINEFLYVIRRLHKLVDIKPITDVCLFREGVQPMWEDPENLEGGKWIFKMRKNTAEQRLFESLIMWMGACPFKTMIVNGVLISVRGHQTILSLWTKTCPGSPAEFAAQEAEIRDVLKLKQMIPVIFKGNDESLRDRSSFRQPVKPTS